MSLLDEDLIKLRAINKDIWDKEKWGKWLGIGGFAYVFNIGRQLTNKEIKFIYKCVRKYKLICYMFTAGNQGVGLQIYEPDPSMGISSYPGVTFNISDTKQILRIWQDQIPVFEDNAPKYRFRKWCEAKGYHHLGKVYQYFKAFVNHPDNLDMMARYNFKKPYIQPLIHFEY